MQSHDRVASNSRLRRSRRKVDSGALEGESAILPGFPLLSLTVHNGRYVDISQKEKSDGDQERSLSAVAEEDGRVRSGSARQRYGSEGRCMDHCGTRRA